MGILDFISGQEGYSPRATWDYKQWTNGFGTRARHAGEVIDRDEATRRLKGEVDQARGYVTSSFGNLEAPQLDALTSFTYNLGPGWTKNGSRLSKAVAAGDWKSASSIMQEYNKAGGSVLPGLVSRRRAEGAMMLGGPAAPPGPSSETSTEPELPPMLIPGSTEFWNQNRAKKGEPELPPMMMLGGPDPEAPSPQAGQPPQSLWESIMNPMTLAGLSILGSPTRDVGQGMQAGLLAQQQGAKLEELRRRRGLEEQQRANLMGLLQDPEIARSLPPGAARLAQAAGPEIAFDMLAKHMNPAVPKPTSAMQNLEAAGIRPGTPEYQQALRDYVNKPQTNINMPQMETKYDQTLGEELAKEFVNANRTAATAQRDIANLDVMKQALADPNLYTGAGGAFIQSVKKGAETLFGVPVKGTSSGEVMQNLANEIAVSNKDKLPGPMSDADRQFLVDMAPNLSKTPEGNRLIIGLGMEHKRWQIARAEAARAYAGKNHGRLDSNYWATVGDLDAQYEQKFNTLLGEMRGMGQLAPRSPTVGIPTQYKQKYGLE